MNPIISLLDSFVPIIADKAKSYGRHTYVGYFWVGMRVIQFSVIPYFVLYLNKKHFKTELKFESVYLYMIIIGMGMIFIPIIFQRFTNYFYPMLSLSMADLICKGFSSLNINKKCMSAVLSLVVCVGYGTYFIYLDFYEMWVPYSWVFNPIQYSERYKFANGGEK
jgi:asparagine N-glycosylation enzyme membrane subunit Stt3